MRIVFLLVLVLAIAWWWWGLRRAATLFTVVVRQGRIARTSGKIPARLLSDIADIIERSGVIRAHIRAVRREDRPVLQFEGEMSPGTAQQMRNVVGQFSAAEIENAPRR